MKIGIHVEPTLLNNFYLIHKGDFLMIKVPKLHSEVTDRVQKISKFEIDSVANNIYISTKY